MLTLRLYFARRTPGYNISLGEPLEIKFNLFPGNQIYVSTSSSNCLNSEKSLFQYLVSAAPFSITCLHAPFEC